MTTLPFIRFSDPQHFYYLQQEVEESEFTPLVVVNCGAAGGGLWTAAPVPTPLLQGVLVLAPGHPHCRPNGTRVCWVEGGVPQHHRAGLAV